MRHATRPAFARLPCRCPIGRLSRAQRLGDRRLESSLPGGPSRGSCPSGPMRKVAGMAVALYAATIGDSGPTWPCCQAMLLRLHEGARPRPASRRGSARPSRIAGPRRTPCGRRRGSGSRPRRGAHQVAQKSSRTNLPRKSASVRSLPSSVLTAKSGAASPTRSGLPPTSTGCSVPRSSGLSSALAGTVNSREYAAISRPQPQASSGGGSWSAIRRT